MARKKNHPKYESVTITDIGAEGKAIAKVNDIVVFVPYAIPGDVVDLQVIKKRKRFQEARITKVHEYSKDRVEAICEHYGICGGCKWQSLPYDKQLFYKQKQVVDQLTRLGKIELPEVTPILGSAKTDFYRNKLEFTFSNKKWLTFEQMDEGEKERNMNGVGFHIPGLFDKVVDINKCWLQSEPSNAIRNEVRAYAEKVGISYFDLRNQTGFLRTMIVRTSSTGEVMVILAFYHEQLEWQEGLLTHLTKTFPEITSLMYVINSKANDTIGDQNIKCYKGTPYIYEEMEGIRFKIGPKSFYQTNSEQAYELYKLTREFADLQKDDIVYDLYTGTGTIANFVARQCKKVVGIEYVPEAIEDAILTSDFNKIENTAFFAGDMKDILTDEFVKKNGQPDVIITDPPRAGMHEDVVKVILNAAPQKIVYVSCNPATQARDLQLMDEKYRVARIQPVDMFPHTHHIENIALLEKR
jgi:23S rRNA (uracil1939-C5)-methyltransferase